VPSPARITKVDTIRYRPQPNIIWEGWYAEAYTDNVVIREGFAQIPAKPGFGTALRQELLSSGDVGVRVSA
jgi:L-alanine-DL-glutamate epimerase-like enolase superfamily enzyme